MRSSTSRGRRWRRARRRASRTRRSRSAPLHPPCGPRRARGRGRSAPAGGTGGCPGARPVRQRDVDVAVETPGAADGGIEAVRVVAGADDHDALAGLGAVEALEEAVDDLDGVLPVVVVEAVAVAEGIDLVDEEDRRRLLPRLVEGLAHGPQQVAQVTLGLPVGEAPEDEGDAARAGQRACEGRLARPGRPVDQDAAVDFGPVDGPVRQSARSRASSRPHSAASPRPCKSSSVSGRRGRLRLRATSGRAHATSRTLRPGLISAPGGRGARSPGRPRRRRRSGCPCRAWPRR